MKVITHTKARTHTRSPTPTSDNMAGPPTSDFDAMSEVLEDGEDETVTTKTHRQIKLEQEVC